MSFAHRHRWQFVVFFTEFVYMGLELAASRLLSPTYGTTLDVWASIIGTILAASAAGNWLAGRLAADQGERCAWAVRALSVCGAWLSIVPLATSLLEGAGVPSFLSTAALPVCVSLFFVPGVCVGMLSPLLLANHAHDACLDVGEAAASLNAAMTLGGLAGTFSTGFFLAPALGTTALVVAMSAAMLVLAVTVAIMGRQFSQGPAVPLFLVFCAAVAVGGGFLALSPAREASGVDVWRDTRYGRAHVVDGTYGGDPVRKLLVSGGFESAMFLDPERRDDLVFDYARASVPVLTEALPEGSTALVMGGGAYSLPRWMACSLGRAVDVVEIDGGVTDMAREFFSLSEAESEAPHGLVTHEGDGRVFLRSVPKGSYDVVYNDTFAGNEPAAALASVEAARLVRDALAPGGVYVSNVIGDAARAGSTFLGWEVTTLREVFSQVHVLACHGDRTDGVLNWLVVATDDEGWRLPEGSREIELDLAGSEVLTDDRCPVDVLTNELYKGRRAAI